MLLLANVAGSLSPLILIIARQMGLRGESEQTGYLLEGLVGGGEKAGDLVCDALVDHGLGRTVGDVAGDLCQVTGADA